ncbi:putative P-loop containing nucleoside triphosphate hydrolase [Rosellinia necatrix]|uniref:Putative P-loop containing nucleoside triphosphate hydrolase n=1 Tax=Rosellinia necatrix TaxID=77044 RepID=A0A1S8A6I7_ROSNE|nr:putative P-loop containing nucleoside triphosphate hydrolase [Rosellinia necatrix]
MDPVSAVGLAAATAQFIGLAIKATVICLQVRDSTEAATTLNQELETSMREVKESRTELSSTLALKAPRRIADLASKCEQMTDELIALLEHVRGAKGNATTAKRVFRALKERKTVEKMQNSLKEKEKVLESLLVQDLWRRFDLQHAEQSKYFGIIDSRTQDIIKELAKQYSNANDHTKGLVQNITSLAAKIDAQLELSSSKTQKQLEQTMLSVSKLSEKSDRRAKQFSDKSQQRRRQDAFLKTLFFPEMNERRANIREAAPGTLEWVFTSIEPPGPPGWDDFGGWLRDRSSVYWICGKLGSGKSTLMAHIVDDDRTRAGLEAWGRRHPLHIFSFFFWRPGTQLQKSTIGLLRSLLYEILLAEPNITLRLMRDLLIYEDRIPTWTEKSLTAAVIKAITIASHTRFCIFIDGLDEFLGDYDELLDLIFELQDLKNVKFCVSSRPEVHLTTRLAKCEQLRLEHLNYPDIVQYVEQKLASSAIGDSVLSSIICDEIVHRSEGVFLWATLATQDVLQGAISGDEEHVLLERIERTPRAIDDLFGMMLENVDELYKASLAFYVKVADLWDILLYSIPLESSPFDDIDSNAVNYITSVSVITSARVTAPISFGDTFMQSCQQTEVQVGARSAGLLEVRQNPWARSHEILWESGSNWFIPSEQNWSHSIYGDPPSLARGLTTDPIPYPDTLEYECRGLNWVHRSAYDFVHDPHNIHKFGLPQPSTVDVLSKLIEGGLKYFVIAPSYQISESERSEIPHGYPRAESDTLTYQRLKYQLICLGLLWERDSSAALVATDQLRDTVRQLDPRELVLWDHENLVLPADYVFWKTCGTVSYWGYVRRRIRKVPPALYTTLLSKMIGLSMDDHEYELAFKFLNILLKDHDSGERIKPSVRDNLVFFCRESTLIPVGVSYSYVRHEQHGFTQPYLDMAMEALMLAFTRFWSFSCRPREYPTANKILLQKILGSMSKISSSADLYIGIASHRRLSLQLAAPLFEEYVRGRFHWSGITSGLRIVCLPWYRGEPGYGSQEFSDSTQRRKAQEFLQINRFIIVEPSALTTEILLQALSLEYGGGGVYWKPHLSATREALQRWYERIIRDVWENEHQMSSTEQLFALACIRSYLPRLLESIWRDTELPTKSYWPEPYNFLQDDSSDKKDPAVYNQNMTYIDGTFMQGPHDEEWVTDADEFTGSDWMTSQDESSDAD